MTKAVDQAPMFLYYWRIVSQDEREHRAWPWADPEGEHEFHPTRGWRFDWAWPDSLVAVEVDGGQWEAGGGRHGTDADRDKTNHAAALGWRVLHFSPHQLLTDPRTCVLLVMDALNGSVKR